MLAGCSSSTLVSPRHRLRSESSKQLIQPCHYQVPSMNMQRLDLPCTLTTTRSHLIKPLNATIPPEAKPILPNLTLPQHARVKRPSIVNVEDVFWHPKRRRSERFAEYDYDEDPSSNRAKRKKVEEALFIEFPGGLTPQEIPLLSCTGDEERAFLIPNEGPQNPWIEPMVKQRPAPEPSGSTPSSRSLSKEEPNEEKVGLNLVGLIAQCVEAIASKNTLSIPIIISQLGNLSSPKGNSPIARLSAYYTEALSLKASRLWPHAFHLTLPREKEEDSSTRFGLLNQITPIPKFIHYTANEILSRALEGQQKIHIIDLDIKQGLQWPSFFQTMASKSPPPSIRITGLGTSKKDLKETGERLAGFAGAFNLQFDFHPVVDRLQDLRLWMLHVKQSETVAVNSVYQMHRTLNGESLGEFSGLIKSAKPVAIVLAEHEADHDEAIWESRVCNSMEYYSAMFDLVDMCLPSDNEDRMLIEEMYGREITEVVACDGRHRRFEKWKGLMEKEGFRNLGIEGREVLQSELLLRMYSSCEDYKVTKFEREGEVDGICLTWMGQPVVSVSAWSPLEG